MTAQTTANMGTNPDLSWNRFCSFKPGAWEEWAGKSEQDFLPSLLDHSRDPEEAKVCDDHLVGVMKDILGFQILVDDAFGMQVAHSLQI